MQLILIILTPFILEYAAAWRLVVCGSMAVSYKQVTITRRIVGQMLAGGADHGADASGLACVLACLTNTNTIKRSVVTVCRLCLPAARIHARIAQCQ